MSKQNIVFKPYQYNPQMLLPPSFDELIDKHHPVRLVQKVIAQIDLDPLLKEYKGGGTSSYHPRMLLSAVVFSYLSNTYSSRKIEAALKENIHYMWLTGMSTPDHNTINRFRSSRLKNVIKEIFAKVVTLLVEEQLLGIEEVYTDGTKIEANANKYTFVWGKAIKTQKEKTAKQLEELWNYTQKVAVEELKDTAPIDFKNIDAAKVKEVVEKIDEALKDKVVEKKTADQIKKAKTNFIPRLEKYEQQQAIMGNRNSYSKTDTDATFMRMKEDHMLNGQLKAGYNLQASSCGGEKIFCVNYTLHQKPTDTTTLISHLDQYKNLYGTFPKTVTADAGYGSHENYQYLEDNNINAYVKYNTFHQEQKRQPEHKKGFKSMELYYNKEQDCYYCPMGQRMSCMGTSTRTTENGYEQNVKKYQAQNCNGCPLRGVCHQSKTNRTIEVNHELVRLKNKARENLLSETGIEHRKKRCYTIEPVFACIKQNKNFKRFLLRSLPKVNIEAGLCLIGFNIKQKAILLQQKRA